MGFYWGTCFTRQNYSLTLNHVKLFSLFCHCYFIIFNYDLYYLLKPVKICFFEKMSLYMEWYWAWYVLGPDTNTGNTMMTPSLFCPPVWNSKGGIKKNSRNIFFKFSPNLFRNMMESAYNCLSILSMEKNDLGKLSFYSILGNLKRFGVYFISITFYKS